MGSCRISRKWLLIGSTSLAVAGAAPVFAQQSNAGGQLEEVVVTGFRASLADALTRKRESDGIMESVTAEDMGKMPDQDIAESLQRLPGVQIDREDGQGSMVRIRGLSQNLILLNGESFLTGLEAYSNGENSAGTNTGTGAGVVSANSLASIPADLVGGVDVYLSSTAKLIEGALGGIIDLRTPNPLTQPVGWKLSGNLRESNNEYTNQWTPVGSVVGSYNWNHTLAVVASLSYSDTDTHTDSFSGGNFSSWSEVAPKGGLPAYYFPKQNYYSSKDIQTERIASSLGISYAPTDSWLVDATWMHTTYDINTKLESLKETFQDGIDATQPYNIDSNGVMLSDIFKTHLALDDAVYQVVHSTADDFHFNAKWDGGGRFRGDLGAVYASTNYRSDQAESDITFSALNYAAPCPIDKTHTTGYCITPRAPNQISSTNLLSNQYINNGTIASFVPLAPWTGIYSNYADATLNQQQAWTNLNQEYKFAFRGDGEYDAGLWWNVPVKISAGARYADDSQHYYLEHYLVDLSGQGQQPVCSISGCFGTYSYYHAADVSGTAGASTPAPMQVTYTALQTPTAVFLENNFFPSNRALTGNVPILFGSFGQMTNPAAWRQSLNPGVNMIDFRDPLASYDYDKKSYAAYVMTDFGNKSDNFHINAGVRFVDNQLTIGNGAVPAVANYVQSSATVGVDALLNPTTVVTHREYTDVLPSMTAWYDLTDQDKLRFSAARVVSPPTSIQVGAGASYHFHTFTGPNNAGQTITGEQFVSGQGGNPHLNPYKATQLDLSWEKYFGKQGGIAAALFYKSVDSFVETTNTIIFVPDSFGGTYGPFTQAVNGAGGSIYGGSVSAQYAFDFGVGFNSNYTYSQSSAPTTSSFDGYLPIPGVSLHALTQQVYYENNGFAARMSYSWRSKSLDPNSTLFSFANAAQGGKTITYGIFDRDYGQLDAQVSYQVTPEFGVLAEGINLTDSYQSAYMQFPNLPFSYGLTGRRFQVGGRFKF